MVSGSLVACVDDDFRVRESVENLLHSAGFVCMSFASAEEFLESGVLERVACLLLDVRMGGLNGLELQRAVRAAQGITECFQKHADVERLVEKRRRALCKRERAYGGILVG